MSILTRRREVYTDWHIITAAFVPTSSLDRRPKAAINSKTSVHLWGFSPYQRWLSHAGSAVLALQQGTTSALTCTTDDGAVLCCTSDASSAALGTGAPQAKRLQIITPGGVSVEIAADGQVMQFACMSVVNCLDSKCDKRTVSGPCLFQLFASAAPSTAAEAFLCLVQASKVVNLPSLLLIVAAGSHFDPCCARNLYDV